MRVASELGVQLGSQVGYAVRFTDNTSPRTLLKVMTDGVLLNEIGRDPLLLGYDTLILDEAHERSLNIDFLLGYLKTLLPRRPDLKLVITSATIDVKRFSEHFGDAPVVEIGGRGFPVDVVYVPPALDAEGEGRGLDDQIRDVVTAIIEEDAQRATLRDAPDILVFLAGERDILEVAQALRRASFREPIDVLPLYARLPMSEQERVFNPGERRRVVLATNVAETSLTVPRIGYVIDPGTARISRYSYRSKLQRLPIEPISQASANQRAGRCGRIAPGVCFRLYSEQDFQGRSPFTDAEILRTNLASVVLQMKLLRLGELGAFPLLDVPDPRAVNDAHTLLNELGALDGTALTALGRQMARLPVDPRLARMLLAAGREGVVAEVLVIVAALSVQDPRERPVDKQQAADQSHSEWRDPDSDFLSWLRLWRWYGVQRESLSRSALRKACVSRFLAPMRMQEWRDVHRQLHVALTELGVQVGELKEEVDYGCVHRALLAGSLALIGQRQEQRDYLGTRSQRFTLFPGSTLNRRPPPWLIAAEIVETRRVYARCVGGIDRAWVEQVGAHMLKRQQTEPHWSRKRGEAVAHERATLLGLTIYERKLVRLAPFDPEAAREILIRDGLVAGDLATLPPCVRHNVELVAELRDREARLRRRDLLVDERVQFAFYDARIPADVVDLRAFDRWSRSIEATEPGLLHMSEALLLTSPAEARESDYPGVLRLDGIDFELRYRFAPGADDDGIALQVPLGLLPHLQQRHLDYLVPGAFEARITALLWALPRAARKQLAPIPEAAQRLCLRLAQDAASRARPLAPLLCRLLQELHDLRLPIDAWDDAGLEPHCAMAIELRDPAGKLLARSRTLRELQARYSIADTGTALAQVRADGERGRVDAFPEDGVPPQSVLRADAQVAISFPALTLEDDGIALRLFEQLPEARARHAQAVATLAFRALGKLGQRLIDGHADWNVACLRYATLGSRAALTRQVELAIVTHLLLPSAPADVRTQAEFQALVAQLRQAGGSVARPMLADIAALLRERAELVQLLAAQRSPAFAAAVEDITRWLAERVPADFVVRAGAQRLGDLRRHVAAAVARVHALQGRVERDQQHMRAVQQLAQGIEVLRRALPDPAEAEALAMELEELRGALLSPGFKPRMRTSVVRMQRQLEQLTPASRARPG
jgi:ATP-dependent helicase HrpA